MKNSIAFFVLSFGLAISVSAQVQKDYLPDIHGTIRAKYEYEPPIDSGRFEIRNARLNVEGNVIPTVSYKAEIDLSDEGKIKMLDAYVRIRPDGWNFTVGQMRVPFTIDAHRSPHLQFFANRSFIAKQVGNVRDVGASFAWTSQWPTSVILEGGIFNGSGLTEQKDFWTDNYNFSFKARTMIAKRLNVTLSCQKANAGDINVMMWDVGIYWQTSRCHVEGEFLRKNYANSAFVPVNAVDAFVAYRLPLKNGFTAISFLGRYDYMSDHSRGNKDSVGNLNIDDPERHRLTEGVTLSLGTSTLQADVRLNYEQYFYKKDVVPSLSEQSKMVVECVVHF